tara:strand:+ start:3263 stop:4561 length:1299 start_codon:yes stop_codon:yes gene_type:complete
MEKIRDKINIKFQKFITKSEHPFFKDMKRIRELSENFLKYQKNTIISKISYNQDIKIPKDIKEPSSENKMLEKSDLKQLNIEIKKSLNYFNIFKLVSKISKYYIKENELNSKNYNKNNKTILIIGSGPIGLFLSCYLKLTYPEINIILCDNRINKPGFRKPYSRVRPFSSSSKYLSLIIPKLYCMTNNEYVNMINIFILEYLLYSKALLEYDIAILYKDFDWNEYKNMIKEYDIDVVFDCTGGRLKTDVFKNIDISWLKNTVNKDINKQLMILENKNIVHLVDYPKEKKFKLNHFYASINIYDDKMMFVKKEDIDIMNIDDLKYLNNIKKKYFSYDNMVYLFGGIKNDVTRNYLYNYLLEYQNNKYFYMIDVWSIYIRHIIKPSEIFVVEGKDRLFVSLGDSMYHSHFIIGAGLNKTINLAVHAANQLNHIL